MGSENLTTAILGLNETGRCMLTAAASTGLFRIKAVADLDQQKAEKAAREHGCEAFTDYRQLVVQNQLDCLLVAAETHTCDEQIKTAIKRKFNVLKASPPARTFAEALEFVELAKSENVQFAIANLGRFRAGTILARDLIVQGRLGHIFLIAASCIFSTEDRPAWQIDPQVAGGGVLLHDWLPDPRPGPLGIPSAGAGVCPQDQSRPGQAAATLSDGRHRGRFPAVQRRLHGQPGGHSQQRDPKPDTPAWRSTAKRVD